MVEETGNKGHRKAARIALAAAALIALVPVGLSLYGWRYPAQNEAAADPHANLGTARPLADVDTMIAGLSARLANNPADLEGWTMLGWSQLQLGRFAEAVAAYRRAAALAPDDASLHASLAEAHLGTGATAEARRALDRALALERTEPRARYLAALMKDQAGDRAEAVEDWLALLAEAPPGAPWGEDVREMATKVAGDIGMDISARLPAETQAAPGPSAAEIEAAAALPAADQQQMIAGMVDRLAARLVERPRDAPGWIRLMRARMVMEQPDAARAALRSGLSAFAGDTNTQARLRTAAAELGVPSL